MKLENERLYVEIAELGAEVTRIYDKKKGNELLWEGDPAYWKRHSPVLFPNVGKTYHNTVRIRGEQYPTSQHGFARDNTFRCISEKADQASFLFVSNEETRKVYPFDFELIITYVLDNNTLKVTWEVRNTGEETMYFTIGGHPAFCFAGEKETKEDYLLYFPGRKTLDYILIAPGEAAADPSVVYELELDQGYCPVNEEMFARDALIFDGGQFEEVWLCRKDRTPYVGIRCKDFPNFGIWSVKDAPFVCLEPWMGRCDDVGFDRELSEKPNVNKAEPGDRFEQSYVIIAG
ncbi:aldose 1-epimerase family protein [Clostridium sp. Marseille-P3244]|uniref:aldose 1-epimerase family protein n=1 Tax=Clostridium sp. Marseille-P3244 TaxID=1871020 RepID=UPI000930B0D1|nr:aldose 1-epimerase family protein [Clostridium sp. Marseille-P3244]